MTGAVPPIDTFSNTNLPPHELWPELIFARPELQYPARLNCVTELLDKHVAAGHGDAPCLISPSEALTYAQMQAHVNRICNVLVRRLGMIPGNRVLLRSANNPTMVACYLAVLKAGGVAAATMPLLRPRELAYPIEKARIHLAICEARLAADLEATRALAPTLERIVY